MSEQPIDSGNPPEGDPPSDIPNIPELDEYIFKPDPYKSGVVPRLLVSSEVARYLIGKVKREIEFKSAVRVENVAKFYETFEITGHLRTLLDRNESSEEMLRRSITLVRVIAYLGTGDDIAFARDYHKHLVSKARSELEFHDLIFLLDALGPEGDGGVLRNAVVARTEELSRGAGSDYNARLLFLEFEENVMGQLDRAERAQAEKAKMISIADRRKRVEEELKAYLTTDYGFLEFLQPWAAYRLNRETWAIFAAEQTKRPEQETLRQDLANSFRAFYGGVDGIPHLDDEDKESIRVRLLRGIKFFGGEISYDEESFLAQFSGRQFDLLANEGFQLP
jgi:hypothetical protein